ncbi:HAD family hydrolase [Terrisporobacter mayombei]|uniref:Hexitol phosphatase B n=1 Tax=Terrisporobacter mayombei TaxID=1541 RepID=A0ABY9Q441_9FIRM|nr:HAD family phosphatase [Terrisporobacter mayombei]MCC3869093.1 HAD family phosphatase [Terrisporobacter mayombei]WMT82773.1 Hexitol phosphatase B [Terrisporobacter mayombei]
MFDFKGAIFDLDGTLIDSMGVWEKIDKEFLEKRNIDIPSDYIEKINSMSFEKVAQYTIERFNLKESEEQLIKEWNEMAIYEYSNNIKLKPNVKEYLKKLKEDNIRIALSTSSPRILYEPVLKNNHIYEYFDALTSLEDVKRDKNYPDIYLLAAEKLDFNPQDCVGFEDILVAINTLKKAGFKAIGVYDKYADSEIKEIKKISDKYIYDFKEII